MLSRRLHAALLGATCLLSLARTVSAGFRLDKSCNAHADHIEQETIAAVTLSEQLAANLPDAADGWDDYARERLHWDFMFASLFGAADRATYAHVKEVYTRLSNAFSDDDGTPELVVYCGEDHLLYIPAGAISDARGRNPDMWAHAWGRDRTIDSRDYFRVAPDLLGRDAHGRPTATKPCESNARVGGYTYGRADLNGPVNIVLCPGSPVFARKWHDLDLESTTAYAGKRAGELWTLSNKSGMVGTDIAATQLTHSMVLGQEGTEFNCIDHTFRHRGATMAAYGWTACTLLAQIEGPAAALTNADTYAVFALQWALDNYDWSSGVAEEVDPAPSDSEDEAEHSGSEKRFSWI
ncbi:hypothetical protein EDC01DRAFT_628306 [Geopyxis carbonaria]|nr:hypothetical protein EDC01DRAFT_628306 [Geopyxis carbonaria]